MLRKRNTVYYIIARYLTILLFLFQHVNAQEEFVSEPSKHVTTIPFTMLTGGIVILHATLDDYKDTLNFVLDTGSGGISLDSATAMYLGVHSIMSERTVRGIAGMRTVAFTYNHSLHMPGIDIHNLDFHINDYDILTSAYGVRIDGIIGYSFFSRYIVTLDYDNLKMDVFLPGTFKYPRGGMLLTPNFNNLPMQIASIRDNTSLTTRFYFDTGAGLCMLLNEALVKDSSLLRQKRKLYPTEAEGLGGKKSMSLTVIKEMRLGRYRFRNVPTYIFDDEFDLTSYPVLGGLIGNEILRRFNITLNYPDKQIFIHPNKHYSDSFDYSYTGLGMYLIDGAIVVTDIMKKSPGEAAGFHSGDIVVGVENNFSGNIQTYKAILQNSGSKIKILINRNNELMILTIKVKNILK